VTNEEQDSSEATAQAFIGVDVGGTHTDVAVVLGKRIERGKALTTYDDFSRGVLEAVEFAAGRLGLGLAELLGRTRLFINGTTVVTNTITTLNGSRVGVLVTDGFRDVFRFAGGPRLADFDDHLQTNVPDLVQREAIVEIEERVDAEGNVLVELDREAVRAAADRLITDLEVDAIAVCFLSSFANPENELAAREVIADAHPDVFVSLSHQVFPVAGETRRWTTAVLNSFVQSRAELYLSSLETQLRAKGLKGGLTFFQGLGGGISLEQAREKPLALLGSGPAAGAIGANELAKRMGHSRVLLGDMGGTSFDTGIIHDNEIQIDKNLQLGPFQTGVNLVDVVSVGAGGGSIVWVSERGVPQVGPQSAGSTPGPAALGKGGTEPTVTDAMVTLGFIDPDRYLGGRVKLDTGAAASSLGNVLGDRFGWSNEESAAAVHDLVVVNMANAVREVSVDKGHDPREFLFLAYGGTLPMFASQIAERLGISTIVIPSNSSVFCALGLLSADFILRADQAAAWDLGRPDEAERVSVLADRMITNAREAMLAEGFDEEQLTVRRSGDFRFQGQSYELTMPLPDRALTPADAEQLATRFRTLYERTYGEGTAWEGVATSLVNYSVTVVGQQARPSFHALPVDASAPAPEARAERRVFLPAERAYADVPVYDDASLVPGSRIEGPAIIDAVDTTIYLPTATAAERDGFLNYFLTR
jgi:N-methylhydantoinase A